jgi:hypothetical protein
MRYRTAADEETFSMEYESRRRPLLSPWQFAALAWILVCAVAFVVLLGKTQ